jgi:hypothetical protein
VVKGDGYANENAACTLAAGEVMDVVLVAYDLRDQSDRRRSRLREAIRRAFPRYHEHVELSIYLVGSDSRPSAIRDRLKPLLADGDRLFVGKISSSAWCGDEALKRWIEETRSRP